MGRRGSLLREHILWVAKDVFLDVGFERASMDVVAARAETSKRSLYAHFESKEKMFLAVIDLVQGLFLDRLRMPGDYSDEPTDALVMFCGRYLETLCYESSVRMLRVSMAETERFPAQAAQYFDVLFTQVHARLRAYLMETLGISARSSERAAQRLLGRVLYPHLPRALFGMDPLIKSLNETPWPAVDLSAIRTAVAELMSSLRSEEEAGQGSPSVLAPKG